MNAFSPILPHLASAARGFSVSRKNFPARSAAARSLNVVLVYDDFTAGGRATRALAQLKADAGPGAELWPVAWSFDYLFDLRWRAQALGDMDSADVVVLSINRPDKMPAAIDHWIETCLRRERVRSIPVLVLFDDDTAWTLSLGGTTAPVPRQPAPVSPTRSRIAQWARESSPFSSASRSLQPVALGN